MDKNIAALIRDDTYTVGVRFYSDDQYQGRKEASLELGSVVRLSTKTYTYVTDIPDIKIGDHLVVLVSDIPKIVRVESIDQECDIDPNDTIEYKWIVAKIDFSGYEENKKKNKELVEVVSKAYKKNLRGQFRNLLLANMQDEEAKNKILTILGEGK